MVAGLSRELQNDTQDGKARLRPNRVVRVIRALRVVPPRKLIRGFVRMSQLQNESPCFVTFNRSSLKKNSWTSAVHGSGGSRFPPSWWYFDRDRAGICAPVGRSETCLKAYYSEDRGSLGFEDVKWGVAFASSLEPIRRCR
jgi:hypothetical protein